MSGFPEGTTAHQVVIGQGKTDTQIGIVAQELEEVLPSSISTRKETGAKTLKCTDEIFWYMINAIKELSTKVKELESNSGGTSGSSSSSAVEELKSLIKDSTSFAKLKSSL